VGAPLYIADIWLANSNARPARWSPDSPVASDAGGRLARPAVIGRAPMRHATAIEDIALSLPPRARLIGIDLGAKTIGLAISDVERRLASPLRTLARGAFNRDAEKLTTIFSEFDVAGIVLGLPLDLDGRDNPRAQSTRAFARNLSMRTSLPIVLWDERFSTAAVTRSLIANDVSRARRAQVVDKMAAAYILQGALDRLGGLARSQTGRL
jgi:putative holliday junction resolvase